MRIVNYFRNQCDMEMNMDQIALASKSRPNAVQPILLKIHQYFVLKKKSNNQKKITKRKQVTIGALEKESTYKHQ